MKELLIWVGAYAATFAGTKLILHIATRRGTDIKAEVDLPEKPKEAAGGDQTPTP